jgi:hypothetical protein
MTHSLRLESILRDELIGGILVFTRSLVNFFKGILGYVGFLMSMPIVVTLAFIAWALTKWLNRKLKSELKNLFVSFDKAEPHVLCDSHLELKRLRERMELSFSNIHIFQQIYITRPLYAQLMLSIQIIRQSEERLYKAAYPHLQVELTADQTKQISQLYSAGLLEEWNEDVEYDIAMHN